MKKPRRTLLLLAFASVLLVTAIVTAGCGGEGVATTGASTTAQVMTTGTAAQEASNTQAAAAMERYRTEMKALWDKHGAVLNSMGDSLDFSDPTHLSAEQLQAAQDFADALGNLAKDLGKIQAPTEVAAAHAKYADVLGRLSSSFDQLMTAFNAKDNDGIISAMTAIGTLFQEEDAAMTEAEATLEKALGFSLSGDSSTTTTVAGLGSDAQIYTDPTYGYTFHYPAGWAVDKGTLSETAGTSAGSTIGAYDPAGAKGDGRYLDLMMVSTYELNVALAEADIPGVKGEIQGLLDTVLNQAIGAQIVSPLAETKVAGLPGFAATYTYSDGDTPMTATLYTLFKGDKEYQVMIQAATENWDKNQAIFAAMVASFTAA